MHVTDQVWIFNIAVSTRTLSVLQFKRNFISQVRRAAMAWRSNKEAAHAAYCALGGSAQQAARRDQIIHNARTNWELLRFCLTKYNYLKS